MYANETAFDLLQAGLTPGESLIAVTRVRGELLVVRAWFTARTAALSDSCCLFRRSVTKKNPLETYQNRCLLTSCPIR